MALLAPLLNRPRFEASPLAAELSLSEADLEQIDGLMAASVPVSGPLPEMMRE